MLFDTDLNVNVGYFLRIRELLEKIGIWYIKNVEIPVNPDFDGVEVDEKDICFARGIAIDYVISVVLAD